MLIFSLFYYNKIIFHILIHFGKLQKFWKIIVNIYLIYLLNTI